MCVCVTHAGNGRGGALLRLRVLRDFYDGIHLQGVCVCVYLTVDAHTQVFAEMLRGIGIHAYR